jgi:hypothetical protein
MNTEPSARVTLPPAKIIAVSAITGVAASLLVSFVLAGVLGLPRPVSTALVLIPAAVVIVVALRRARQDGGEH